MASIISPLPTVQRLFTLICTPLPLVGDPLSLIGDLLSLIGVPLSLIGVPLSLIGVPLSLIGDPLPLIGDPLPLIESLPAFARRPLPFDRRPTANSGGLLALSSRVLATGGPPIHNLLRLSRINIGHYARRYFAARRTPIGTVTTIS